MYRQAPIFLLILLLLALPLLAQQETDLQELETRLAGATGLERLDLLLQLTEAYGPGDPAKAIAFGSEGLELLAATPDEDREISFLDALGLAHFQLRDYETGLRYFEQAEQLARTASNKPALARALWRIGASRLQLEEYERAVEALSEAIGLFEELGDQVGLARASITAGNVSYARGDYQQGLASQIRAYKAYEEAGDLAGVAGALNGIGLVHYNLGQYDESLDFFNRSLEIWQRLGDKEGVGRLLFNIGLVYRETGDPAHALEVHLRAGKIREQLGNPLSIAGTYHAIGNAYRDLGELEEATVYLQRSIGILEEIGNQRDLADALISIGQLHRQVGNAELAREALERALALATEAGGAPLRPRALRELVETYGGLGLNREMVEAFRQYDAITKERFDEENSRTIAEMQVRFEAEQKEKEIELLEQRQAVSVLELERQRGTRRALVLGFGLISLIALLLFNRYRLKSREALMLETVHQERKVSIRLREVNKLKDEFLANTSHELRTPLYGMTGLAESLIDGATGQLPEATNAHLSMIVSSGHRLGRLIEDILDFSKLAHQSLKLKKRPVDLYALADVVVTLLKPLAENKGLEIVSSISAELPAADADENRLEQILHNLVGNAIKFTRSGRVEVAAEALEDRLIVTVEDTGIGIAQDKLDTIFDAFEQVDSSVQRRFGGTGLGLTVTRKLVELHGGSLGVESEAGKGTRFFFNLPISPESPQTASAAQMAAGEQPVSRPVASEPARVVPLPERRAAQTPSPGAEKILVVDDEPVNLQVLSNHLASEGFEIELASTGQEGLNLLQEKTFDLMILDVMMPKMSGYEVCQALRAEEAIEDIPVILLTAKSQVSDLVTGLSVGANDFLVKPIAQQELLARVRTHLELSAVRRDLAALGAERLDQIKVLQGFLPICCECKKIRDDEGYWNQIEDYIDSHSEATFSHGFCPDCLQERYPDLSTK